MSKFIVKVEHVSSPEFETYTTSRTIIRFRFKALGLEMPIGMLDNSYFYTDLEGWGVVLGDLVFKSSLYKKDKFDCDNYALKAMNICAEKYGLNTLGVAIGDIPQGRHAFNIFFTGENIMLWEPNAGFPHSGEPFEIGEHGYQPEFILI